MLSLDESLFKIFSEPFFLSLSYFRLWVKELDYLQNLPFDLLFIGQTQPFAYLSPCNLNFETNLFTQIWAYLMTKLLFATVFFVIICFFYFFNLRRYFLSPALFDPLQLFSQLSDFLHERPNRHDILRLNSIEFFWGRESRFLFLNHLKLIIEYLFSRVHLNWQNFDSFYHDYFLLLQNNLWNRVGI